MRILLVSSLYPRRDSPMKGIFVHRQAQALAAQGAEIRVVVPVPTRIPWRAGDDATSSVRLDGLNVTYLPYLHVPHRLSARLEGWSLRRRLHSYLDSLEADSASDVILAHWLFPTAFSCLDIARTRGVPLVSSALGSDVHTYPHRRRGVARATRETIERSDQVVTVSHELADAVGELGTPKVPVRVVHNGVDTDLFFPVESSEEHRARLGLPPNGKGICCVSRLVPEKGPSEVIRGFAEIAHSHPDAWLALVGDGPSRKRIAAMVRQLELTERVFLPGSCPPDAVPTWLQASDLFVLASYKEGLPNVILEAMACALPVVATEVGGIPEAVVEGETGRLVPPRRVPPLARALDDLLSDDEMRRSYGRRGFDRVLERFTWKSSAIRVLDVLQETVSRFRPSKLASGATRPTR